MKLAIAISLSITFVLFYSDMGASYRTEGWQCNGCKTGSADYDFDYNNDTIANGKFENS